MNEEFLSRLLRGQPQRRAPVTLEARVLAAIQAEQVAPANASTSQKALRAHGFRQWSLAARIGFLGTALGAAFIALKGFGWLANDMQSSLIATVGRAVIQQIPGIWLYAAGTVVAMLYLMFFGLGALAYRTLFAPR